MNQPDADLSRVASPVETRARGKSFRETARSTVSRSNPDVPREWPFGHSQLVRSDGEHAQHPISGHRFGSRHATGTVSGGPAPQRIQGRLEGATTGGSVLRLGWIGVGLRMELSTGDLRITTSAVRSVTIERGTDLGPAVLAR